MLSKHIRTQIRWGAPMAFLRSQPVCLTLQPPGFMKDAAAGVGEIKHSAVGTKSTRRSHPYCRNRGAGSPVISLAVRSNTGRRWLTSRVNAWRSPAGKLPGTSRLGPDNTEPRSGYGR